MLGMISNQIKLRNFSLTTATYRFIWLPDCKHAIVVEALTMHFNATDESGEIGLKKCPRCTTVIKTLTGRFGNIIRKTFCDVAEVKTKFYGNIEQNQRLTMEIQQNLEAEANSLVNFLPSVKNFYEKIILLDDENAPTKTMRQVNSIRLYLDFCATNNVNHHSNRLT